MDFNIFPTILEFEIIRLAELSIEYSSRSQLAIPKSHLLGKN